MSCQKGNASRTRAQKYKNQFAFKNNLHDKSHKTKIINSIEIVNVCERCKEKLEWRIKYKKYKVVNAPSKCTKCQQKTVKHSYHIMCTPCSKENECCPKCGDKKPLVLPQGISNAELEKLKHEEQEILKLLPERKRRTYLRKKEKCGLNNIESEEMLQQLKKLVLENHDEELDKFDDHCDSDDADEDSPDEER